MITLQQRPQIESNLAKSFLLCHYYHYYSVCFYSRPSLTLSIFRWSSRILLSHSCRSLSKCSRRSTLSRFHLFSPCCSFQRRSSDVLWLSASRRRCSSRSSFRAHSVSAAGSPSPPCASPRTLPCSSSSSWSKMRHKYWKETINKKHRKRENTRE